MTETITDGAPNAEDSAISAVGITRRYANNVTALRDVSLHAAQGEFLTLLGPSGCGKTTLLRIIGGFDKPSSGQVVLNGRDVTNVPAHRRSVNMVFQRPMLFPNLDVFGNVAFGLRIQRLSRSEIETRVTEALELVRLGDYAKRRSGELSGGQMQRVALARAIVMRPEVLLLDEPLSALDMRIRLEMEFELRRVHRELEATFIYVTHDQREALALSDRVAVLNDGRIEQVGRPEEIYDRPTSTFTARFVGDANLVPAEVIRRQNDRTRVRCGGSELEVDDTGAQNGPAWLVVKPGAVGVVKRGDETHAPGSLPGTVLDIAFRGTGSSYRIAVEGLEGIIRAELGASTPRLQIGDAVAVSWPTTATRLLTREEGSAIPDLESIETDYPILEASGDDQ